MVDLFAVGQSLATLGVEMMNMAERYRDNKRECNNISNILGAVHKIVEPLYERQKKLLEREGMSEALEILQWALKKTSEDVETYLKMNPISASIKSRKISEKLLQDHFYISEGLLMLIDAKHNHTTSKLDDIEKRLAAVDDNVACLVDAQQQQQMLSRPRPAMEGDMTMPWMTMGDMGRSGSLYVPDNQNQMQSRSTMDMDTTGVTSVDIHPKRPWIVMGDLSGSFCVWDYEKKETVMKELVTVDSGSYNCIRENSYWFHSVKFITRVKRLVVGDWWGVIHIYNYTNTKLLANFTVPGAEPAAVTLLAAHPTKSYLLSASAAHGTNINLWDWSSGHLEHKHEFNIKSDYTEGVLSVKFDPGSDNFFFYTHNRLMVGNTESYSLTTSQTGLPMDHYFIDHPYDLFVVTLSYDSHNAKIWNWETGDVVATLGDDGVSGRRTRLVAGHRMSPVLLVSVLDDGTVCFWDCS